MGVNEKIAKKIRKSLEVNNITQAELGRRIGLDRKEINATIRRLEKGGTPPLQKLDKIASELGVNFTIGVL